jgi:hypothetical protein
MVKNIKHDLIIIFLLPAKIILPAKSATENGVAAFLEWGMEGDEDGMGYGKVALNIRHVALNIRHVALNISKVALNIRHVALNIPEVALNIPKVALNIPEVERNIPEVERNISKVERNIPKVERNIPEVERNIPEVERNISKVERDFSDTVICTGEKENGKPLVGLPFPQNANVLDGLLFLNYLPDFRAAVGMNPEHVDAGWKVGNRYSFRKGAGENQAAGKRV